MANVYTSDGTWISSKVGPEPIPHKMNRELNNQENTVLFLTSDATTK
jgi:hypothetical protein